MSNDRLTRVLLKAADAAGYAMASREEDLEQTVIVQPEDALRNGHAAAAHAVRRMGMPFARLADLVHHLFALSDLSRGHHAPRGMLPSR